MHARLVRILAHNRPTTSTLAVLLALLSGAGCNGNDDGTVKPTEDSGGPTGPIVFNLKTQANATSFEAEVVPSAVKAHRISSMLLASTALVVADQKVQDRLNTDGGGSYLRGVPLQCWTRPDYPMFSFAIDYTGCESRYNTTGGVYINDHPSGPLLFEYNNFNINVGSEAREIAGVLALDTRDAYPEPLYWTSYNTDNLNPGPDNPVQIGIKLGRETFGVSYSGGTSIDFLEQEWATWGVASIGIDAQQITVVHGGRTPEEVAPDQPTGNDVLKSPIDWFSCRCPTSGIESLDMPLHFSSVTVDIDDLEVEPDNIDDPEVEIPVDYDLFGQGVLDRTGCGTYDVEYQTESAEIPVPVNQLVGAVSFLCATFEIADEQRCSALVAAAASLGEDLKIQITQEEATAVALAAVEADFDTSWCVMPPP